MTFVSDGTQVKAHKNKYRILQGLPVFSCAGFHPNVKMTLLTKTIVRFR